jgi:hypothetical protein
MGNNKERKEKGEKQMKAEKEEHPLEQNKGKEYEADISSGRKHHSIPPKMETEPMRSRYIGIVACPSLCMTYC